MGAGAGDAGLDAISGVVAPSAATETITRASRSAVATSVPSCQAGRGDVLHHEVAKVAAGTGDELGDRHRERRGVDRGAHLDDRELGGLTGGDDEPREADRVGGGRLDPHDDGAVDDHPSGRLDDDGARGVEVVEGGEHVDGLGHRRPRSRVRGCDVVGRADAQAVDAGGERQLDDVTVADDHRGGGVDGVEAEVGAVDGRAGRGRRTEACGVEITDAAVAPDLLVGGREPGVGEQVGGVAPPLEQPVGTGVGDSGIEGREGHGRPRVDDGGSLGFYRWRPWKSPFNAGGA